MKKMWMYILGGLAALIAIAFVGATFGLSSVKNLKISDVDLSKVEDGVHQGAFKQARWNYSVAVTVKDHRITAIELLNPKDPATTKLMGPEADRVVQAQTPNIDAVSGATANSKALFKAIENALGK
jgi:uncharacterized protein with FMN-binding domain